MELLNAQKKHKKNLSKLNSIISEYETKLDARVNQVVYEMITYTKKVTDPPLQPVIDSRRNEYLNASKQSNRQKIKSISYYSDLTFLHDNTLQEEISQLRGNFKQFKSNKPIYDEGRAVGSQVATKPKFVKRKPEILPKEIRHNPFCERNAIKSYELDKGLLSLIEKGKIGKDVNIITAFQKGKPVLQTQKAIFHQGEERFAQLEAEKNSSLPQTNQNNSKEAQKKVNKMNFSQPMYQQNWAITMPKDFATIKQYLPSRQQKPLNLQFRQQIYIKIVRYQVCQDANMKILIRKHFQYKCQIRQILKHIIEVMKIYSIQIGYADSAKVMSFVTRANKLRKQQLLGCLAGDAGRLKSLLNVRGRLQRIMLSLDRVKSCLKFNAQRKYFLKYLNKKQISNRVYWWVVSRWTVKKHKETMKARKRSVEESFAKLQASFFSRFEKIQSQKHFQIHLINQTLRGKENYKEFLNVQITRIFNLKSVSKSIIYMLPYALNQDTINYYYKIMELEEIPNFRERVTFIQVDPNNIFKQSINLSTKLYYNSDVLRKLKKKVKDVPCYFVISYPTLVDVKLAAYLNIPIYGGNLIETLKIQNRSELDIFNMTKLKRHKVSPLAYQNLIQFSDQMIKYCQSVKQANKFIVKINAKYRSHGLALLAFPFSSLPQMYSNTTLINQHLTVDEFYHDLLRAGGIVEVYDESVSVVGVVIEIGVSGETKVLGTFQKISSGFINIGFIFPQKKIQNRWIVERSKKVGSRLFESGHFGSAQLTFYINDLQEIYLQKVQCYLTHLGSSLFYCKFLSEGELTEDGEYLAKILDIQERDGAQEQIISLEARCFCYIPFLLHFGLSDRQVSSFFQLCRMGGVSFDLQNKYGATFILLGSLKSSMGVITTAKDKRGAIKIMLKSIQFIVKQNSHNMSSMILGEKEIRMKERENILNVKERLEDI